MSETKKCFYCGRNIDSKYDYCYLCNQKVENGTYKPQKQVEKELYNREDQILNDNYYGKGRW